MSALRIAELVLNRIKERIRENHVQMDKGCGQDQYMKLCGKNAELRWVSGITREFLVQIEAEEDSDDG